MNDAAEQIAEWLRDRLDVAVENGPELRLKECLFCGRPRTMKVNVERRKFICFHQDCAEAGGLLRLIQIVEGCTPFEARTILAQLVRGVARGHRRPEVLLEERRRLLEGNAAPEVATLHHDLPPEFQPCWTGSKFRIPRYLKERNVPREMLQRFGIGWCDEGIAAGRVVIPIRSAGSTSWVGRKIDPDEWGPKYLTPHSAGDEGADRLLFAYDEIPDQPDVIVAVEGTFDAIRLWSYGFVAAAYLKDRIGPGQVSLLGHRRPRRLVLFPDGGDRRAKQKALEDAARLSGRFEEVAVALLDPPAGSKKTDPDSAPRSLVERAIARARPVTVADALENQRRNLRNPWTD